MVLFYHNQTYTYEFINQSEMIRLSFVTNKWITTHH